MCSKNRHGLNRAIPVALKLRLRQEAGFGCVVCGNAVITYEHIDPVFADARTHEFKYMTVLCGGCQTKSTKGLLSKDTIRKAKCAPKARQKGFSFDAFDVGNQSPVIKLGNSTCENCEDIIRVSGHPVFSIHRPEMPGGPFRLSAEFYDTENSILFSVVSNEYKIENTSWDVEIVGQVIT
jgi:hypothetical protein